MAGYTLKEPGQNASSPYLARRDPAQSCRSTWSGMKAAQSSTSGLTMRWRLEPAFILLFVLFCAANSLRAQDDLTTQNGSSALNGGWITGPASNPLSLLNGPAYRTFGKAAPYDFPDFHPMSSLGRRLPRWLAFEIEERLRFEGYRNGNFQPDNDDQYLLNRLRLQADIHPTPWMRFSAQVQDARPMYQKPPYGPPNENRWDLKLTYAEFGNPEKHWISLRVGRQLINYNNTIMASSEWRNQGRSYDAVVTNLQQGRFHLGVFAASAVVPLASGISHHQQGNNIYGVYGRFSSVIPKSDLEPFVLWHVQPSVVIDPAISNIKGKQNLRAYGFRLKGQPHPAFEYSAEGVFENGTQGSEPIRAWATSDGIAYQKESWRGQPRIFAQFDYASGNANPSGGVHHTFDAIYSTSHDRFGITDILGWQNIQAFRVGGTVSPHLRWTVTAQFLDFRLAQQNDALYNNSGNSVGHGNPIYGKHIGDEADVYSWYEINRHLNFGAGYGHLAAGDFLRRLTGIPSYSNFYVAINFKDNGQAATPGK
jgi:hypothetical protein